MAETRRGAKRRRRYLDLQPRQFVDTTRQVPSVRPVPERGTIVGAPPPPMREITGRMAVDTEKGVYRSLEPAAPVMTRRQFETEHQRLLREFGEAADNPGSFSCQGCRQCANCMFCVDCQGCYRCTHCTRCQDCSHCTHAEDCRTCHGCAYCVRSSNCSGSSYLTMCHSCSDCTYCFGCVGLQKKDFHILNVQYGKTEYFRILKALREEMGF
jgi:hypothetical protein